jgi:hypothetical protein
MKEGMMPGISTTARQVRKSILDSFVSSGRAPSVGEMMAELGLSRTAVLETFPEIATIDTFWVEKGTENIRILSPFSNLPTPYKVKVDGEQKWFAVCGIEALGVWVFFPGQVVQIDAYCRDCGESLGLELQDGQILSQSHNSMMAHLGVPLAQWFYDLPYA